jgi:hypothetical protein
MNVLETMNDLMIIEFVVVMNHTREKIEAVKKI